ncbi:ribbon-helix-helix protein, CopG family [Anaerotignum propionicum]|uniref:ribbon-helix-helix protein, CopG family n=1 Tax=Anaerotignum propionicum TaxID=28446 RepID=UPI0028A12B4A|nr:ribbon-helix-helix protein, CopG family [Anaerotignum propionicum]
MENKQNEKKLKVTSIRIPPELCEQIDKIATESHRTRNEQINYMLKSWLEIKKL